MIIYVDIDGTICRTQGNDYKNACPVPENINKVNKMYHEGHCIIYWTARGTSSGINWRGFTIKQLKSWGCLFHDVRIWKPSYDLFIDDKAKTIEEL